MAATNAELILIDCGSTLVSRIHACFQPHVARRRTITLVEAAEADFSTADLVVISGSPRQFTDPVQGRGYPEQFSFLSRVTCPVLGICAGHQGMGLYHGARISRCERQEAMEPIEFLVEHPLLDGIPSGTAFAERHSEEITLPPGFRLLARSKRCGVEMVVAEDLRRVGVQFHPEISGEPGFRFFANLVSHWV